MIIMLFLALVLFIVYFIHTFHYSRHWMENFEVTLAFSEEQAGEGDTLFLYETAVNKKKMGLPIMCVKFLASRFLQFEGAESGTVSDHFYRNDVMSVDGFEKVRRKLKFTCKKRGFYQIQEAELVSYDLFCRHTFVHKIPVEVSLLVYPSRMDIRKLMPVFRHMTGSCKTNVPLFEDPFLSGGVREYTPEDSMRKIHWKASARMGNWQVKTAEYTSSTPVVILLNLESPGVFVSVDLMEESIRLAYSFVYYLSKEGVETKLVISGDEKYCMEGTGRTQIAAVRRALALISYEHPLSKGEDFVIRECEKIRREQHVILISAAGKKPMQKAVSDMLHRNESLTWIAPTFSEYGEDNEFREIPPSIAKCLVKWRGM